MDGSSDTATDIQRGETRRRQRARHPASRGAGRSSTLSTGPNSGSLAERRKLLSYQAPRRHRRSRSASGVGQGKATPCRAVPCRALRAHDHPGMIVAKYITT